MPCRLPTKRWLARSVLPHSLTSNWNRLPEPLFVPPGHLFVRLPVLLPVRRSAIAPQRSEKTEPPQQLPSLCESWSKTSSRLSLGQELDFTDTHIRVSAERFDRGKSRAAL